MGQPHISLAAEKIGSIFGLPITNSIVMTWVTMLVLISFAFISTKKMSQIPGYLQQIAEVIVAGLYSLFESVVGEKHINGFFPLIATIFLFVIVANWGGLLPGVGTIGFREETAAVAPPDETGRRPQIIAKASAKTITEENVTADETQKDGQARKDKVKTAGEHSQFVPLLRGATADLNTTLAIAIVAVLSVQYYGFKTLGAAYFNKFFNFKNPIMFGVGLLEIISEFSRIISFAFRLFGNIFAGEVLLTVIAFLMPLVAPLPFLGLELFVGFIQALVFSMLTAVFLNMATISHEGH